MDYSSVSSVWVWLFLAVVLGIVELSSGTFILLFFALSALFAALAAFAGFLLFHQILVFSAVGIALLFLFRKRFLTRRKGESSNAQAIDIGKTVLLELELSPRAEGMVKYQGTEWTAVNVGHSTLLKGQVVKIVGTDGIKLLVQALT